MFLVLVYTFATKSKRSVRTNYNNEIINYGKSVLLDTGYNQSRDMHFQIEVFPGTKKSQFDKVQRFVEQRE